MSYQVGAVCYSTSISAVRASAAREVGSLRQFGNSTVFVDSTSQTDNSITYLFRDVVTNATVTSTQTVNPLPCGLLDASDGLFLGWAVAGVWLTTSFVLYHRKAVHE